MHPFPNFIKTIQEKIGMVDPEYFDSYNNETINGLVYKLYKIPSEYKRITVSIYQTIETQ
jgi:hypothetical protein